MDKTAIKNFAVWARDKLIKDIKYKAGTIGITKNGIAEKLPQSTSDLHFYDIGTKEYAEVSGIKIKQRAALVKEIQTREHSFKNFQEAFDNVVEEVAYTWFNRLIAIRFMEVNDYLPSGVRVLSSENKAKKEPDMVTTPFDTDLEFTSEEQDRIIKLKDDNKLDELFRMLFIKQCNKLHDILPELFEKTDDYSELLLTISFTDPDGIIYHLVNDIEEDDFNVEKEGQVQIIGWMYQFYNIEPKAVVFSRKGNVKIKKEEIPAATQLFTPDWIVRYMVQNSLGRIYINDKCVGITDEKERINKEKEIAQQMDWKYYLPEAEQTPEVRAQLNAIHIQASSELSSLKLIDPCMGSGHILVYAFEVLMQIYLECGYTQRDATSLIIQNNLFGLDVDDRAYQLAYFAVMMKARSYDRRILTRGIKPNVYSIKESNFLVDSWQKISDDEKFHEVFTTVVDTFIDAKEYGSLLTIPVADYDYVLSVIDDFEQNGTINFETQNLFDKIDDIRALINQAKILSQKYYVVITNPPYMGRKGLNSKLSSFIEERFSIGKSDLYSSFILRCDELTSTNGYTSMVTMHTWMFISSFKNLRDYLLYNTTFLSFAHTGAATFEELNSFNVLATAFIMKKMAPHPDYRTVFLKLADFYNTCEKINNFHNDKVIYYQPQSKFKIIPEKPFVYWFSNNLYQLFEKSKSIKDFGVLTNGLFTCNNNRFVRYWFEVSNKKIGFNKSSNDEAQVSQKKWFPYIKGGNFCKWYGNNEYVVNYEFNGNEIRQYREKHGQSRSFPGEAYYFKSGITWSPFGFENFGVRYKDCGSVFDIAGSSLFVDNPNNELYILAFLASKVGFYILSAIAPTVNFQIGTIGNLPLVLDESIKSDIIRIAQRNIALARLNWDSYEESWDFSKNPLINSSNLISESFSNWKEKTIKWYDELKKNEEKINYYFIRIYGLDNIIKPEVAERDISIRKAELKSDIIRFISYSVGCMFGRYSLDKEGLVFAGGNFDDVYWKYKGQAALDKSGEPLEGGYAGISLAEYHYPKFRDSDDWSTATELSFEPDADNCIPITDDEYFKDDIVGLFCAWLKKVYGEDTLEENLDFIANALGNKGKTSREVIRNYFLKDFFKDHVKTYQKRPIYWLFDSGKQNGFKALVYMHRWNADTIGNVRVEYLHRIQRVYEKEITRMQEIIDNSHDNKEISNATKRKEKLQKQIKETKDYDAKIAHLALSRIDIDLDDGVKVNYEKVQTADGKKMQILAKI